MLAQWLQRTIPSISLLMEVSFCAKGGVVNNLFVGSTKFVFQYVGHFHELIINISICRTSFTYWPLLLSCRTSHRHSAPLHINEVFLKGQISWHMVKTLSLFPLLCPLIDKVNIWIYVNIITMSVYIMNLYMD